MNLWLRLFLACGLLSTLSLGGLAWWQQRGFADGFVAYLDSVAHDRAVLVADRLADLYVAEQGWDRLRTDPMRFGGLLEGRPEGRPPQPPAPTVPRMPPPVPATDDFGRPAPGPAADSALFTRLRLVDAEGRYVAGSRRSTQPLEPVPVRVDDETVGYVEVAALPAAGGSLEQVFASGQRQATWTAVLVAIGVALLLGLLLARRIVRPLRDLSAGTQALAAGDYAQRIDVPAGDEIGALARDFNHLAHSLAEAREARRRWGQDIAHELRTPIAVLQAELQTLIDGVRPLDRTALVSLDAECTRLATLVGDLKSLELAEAGALEYRFAQEDFGELVDERVASHRSGLQAAGLAVAWHAPSGSVQLSLDRQRMAQLIDNLLLNARLYTDAPGEVAVSLRADDDAVQLVVEDSAPGVTDHDLPRLFDRLFRADPARERGRGGSGLGLAICEAIARAHGGSIAASHAALGGLRVSVSLPRGAG